MAQGRRLRRRHRRLPPAGGVEGERLIDRRRGEGDYPPNITGQEVYFPDISAFFLFLPDDYGLMRNNIGL
ncbi:MAG: hypothetical protein METHAR1v1_1640012 [Methanothrix sp.]|nr:MAG: hypothetical protein METHAR1v1_1640012 [Methanothrix sp.]